MNLNPDNETAIEALTEQAGRAPYAPLVDMTITSRNHPHTILVTVEQEDGVVAYAEIDGHRDPTGLFERCYVTTADRSVHWEYGSGGDWHPAKTVNISREMQRVMASAARAGLVASGSTK